MKRLSHWCVFIVVSIAFIALIYGCGSISSNSNLNEASMKDYYSKEDFKCIIIGESTFQDVYNIAPNEIMQVTSYGGFCEYPMEAGGQLRIKFYGKELIVGMIEEIYPFTTID